MVAVIGNAAPNAQEPEFVAQEHPAPTPQAVTGGTVAAAGPAPPAPASMFFMTLILLRATMSRRDTMVGERCFSMTVRILANRGRMSLARSSRYES